MLFLWLGTFSDNIQSLYRGEGNRAGLLSLVCLFLQGIQVSPTDKNIKTGIYTKHLKNRICRLQHFCSTTMFHLQWYIVTYFTFIKKNCRSCDLVFTLGQIAFSIILQLNTLNKYPSTHSFSHHHRHPPTSLP